MMYKVIIMYLRYMVFCNKCNCFLLKLFDVYFEVRNWFKGVFVYVDKK